MHEIAVRIRDKIAQKTCETVYVCGNSDFVINFDFDEEWNAHEAKTARFDKKDGTFVDIVFTGNVCNMPILSNVYGFNVGVFAGNLRTTTPAYVPAKKSILCGGGLPADPSPDVYAQIMARLNELENGEITPEQIAQAVEDYLRENPVGGVDPDELTQAVEAALQAAKDSGEFDGADGKSAYQYAQEGGYKGTEAEFAAKLAAEIPAPYTLPTASADTLGGVKVGNGLQMNGDVLGVVPDGEYELIEEITLEEDSTVTRTKEPDGTLYNFKKFRFMVISPAVNEAANYVNGLVYSDNGSRVIFYMPISKDEVRRTHAEIWRTGVTWDAAYTGNTNASYDTLCKFGSAEGDKLYTPNSFGEYIASFSINVKLPAGTIIKIWGVRA